MNNDTQSSFGFDIAVVGMSCCLPKARSIEEFWENIATGRECISFFSEEELLGKGVDENLVKNPYYVKAGAVLDDIEMFDAAFFGYSPREAQVMDPQHRLFLETCWNAWEDAGYTSGNDNGLVGVFGSATMNTYILNNLMSHPSLMKSLGHLQMMVGNDKDFLTTRVSYQLNFKGPSYAVQTACSSSLTAIHVACNSLLSGECEMALAGGSSVRFPFGEGYMYFEGGTSSPDGHCYAFDARAKGSVVGNGAGVVVLKRLSKAIQDQDHIYGVIKGSAVANDGGDKSAFATPSHEGQARAISSALAIADVPAETIGYVEAHGTGTLIGDPIEFLGLKQAYESFTDKKQFICLGSTKPNIGHLDAAAGVCGLIKVLLCTKNKKIPPLVNFEIPNPDLDVKNSPFYFNTQIKDWDPEGGICRAGVTGIGLGGANAHIIVEQPPVCKLASADRTIQLIPISAKTESSLKRLALNLSKHLENNPEVPLADTAFTMQMGRKKCIFRHFVVGASIEDISNKLWHIGNNIELKHEQYLYESTSVVFMFPGHGSQNIDMLEELYYKEPLVKKTADQCLDLIETSVRRKLEKALLPKAPEDKEVRNQLLCQTEVAQLSLFIVDYVLAKLFEQWGIHASFMIGHDVGEFVAACLAKVFSLEDALKIIRTRGALMGSLHTGKMVSVHVTEKEAAQYQTDRCNIAYINGPNRFVFSGDNQVIKELMTKLSAKQVPFYELNTSHAFHSYMMDDILDEFRECVSRAALQNPSKPFVSNVSGDLITPEEATSPNYWARHLRNTVYFGKGIKSILKNKASIFLEIGPGDVLNHLVKHVEGSLAKEGLKGFRVLSTCPRNEVHLSLQESLVSAVGSLWQEGVEIDWKAFHFHQRSRVSLPTYPFEKKRFWIDPKDTQKEVLSTIEARPIDTSIAQKNVTYQVQIADLTEALRRFFRSFGNHSIQFTTCAKSMPFSKAAQVGVSPSQVSCSQSHGVTDQVMRMIRDVSGVDALSQDQDLKKLGMHSLMLTQLLSRLRDAFSIEITMQELFEATKIKDLVCLVEKHTGSKKAATDTAQFGISQCDEDVNELVEALKGLPEAQIEQLLKSKIED